MSKFLKILSENAPDKSQHHQLLSELLDLLKHLGFDCQETNEGVFIGVAQEEDAEAATNTAAATSLLSQKDKVNLSNQAKTLVPVFQKAISDVKKQMMTPSTTI
jgi:hypothetical protein